MMLFGPSCSSFPAACTPVLPASLGKQGRTPVELMICVLHTLLFVSLQVPWLCSWLTGKKHCRCLKSCQDVGVACRSDLCNGLLSGTIYLAQQPATQQVHDLISSCLDSFLAGDIDGAYAEFSAEDDIEKHIHELQLATAATAAETSAAADMACDDTSDSSSQTSGLTADADIIDDYLKPPSMHRLWHPLTLVVGVPALPKGALVEVQPEACTVEAMTDLEPSHGSSEDEDGGTSQGRSNWAARLVNQEATPHGASTVRCSSLTSHEAYLCCQIVFDSQIGSVVDSVECLVDSLSATLTEAGMTTQHVASCTVYSHTSRYAHVNDVLLSFQKQWLQKHAFEVLVLHVPVWLLMTGMGAKLQVLPESFICVRLTACGGDS